MYLGAFGVDKRLCTSRVKCPKTLSWFSVKLLKTICKWSGERDISRKKFIFADTMFFAVLRITEESTSKLFIQTLFLLHQATNQSHNLSCTRVLCNLQPVGLFSFQLWPTESSTQVHKHYKQLLPWLLVGGHKRSRLIVISQVSNRGEICFLCLPMWWK